MHTNIHLHAYKHTFAYIQIYIHIYPNMHTNTHTQAMAGIEPKINQQKANTLTRHNNITRSVHNPRHRNLRQPNLPPRGAT